MAVESTGGPDQTGAGETPERSLKVMETIAQLLSGSDLSKPDLESDLSDLVSRHGATVYAELIHLLSHLRFEPDEARAHWTRILEHRTFMSDRLGMTVDLRVALLSYFVEVNRKLKNPKIIELQLFEQTQESAYRDELTGLCNFRYFKDHLGREIERAERYGLALSLVMVDIDDFKTYNDTNGHETGNEALATVARLLVESLRKIDVPARYGGEEFALILPSTAKLAALGVAERTRRRIDEQYFPCEGGQPLGRLTASMGIASYPADAADPSDLVRRADSALYVAKTMGKNEVHLYGQNRRSFRRIKAALDGKICVLSAECHPLTTIDISAGGLLFHVDRKLNLGSLVDVELMLPDAPRPITTCGRVVRVEEKGDDRFEAALRILHVPSEDQVLLNQFIRCTSNDETQEQEQDQVNQ